MNMNEALLREIVAQCTYKPGWRVLTSQDSSGSGNGCWYIQLSVDGTDSVTKEPCVWRSGKRYISSFMCRQEIVGLIFDLIKSAELHEVHEWFRYKGASIYNPHLDPDALVEVAKRKVSFNYRQNAMRMEENDNGNDS